MRWRWLFFNLSHSIYVALAVTAYSRQLAASSRKSCFQKETSYKTNLSQSNGKLWAFVSKASMNTSKQLILHGQQQADREEDDLVVAQSKYGHYGHRDYYGRPS